MSLYDWKGKKVRNCDGRKGVIQRVSINFTEVDLIIQVADGSSAKVTLNHTFRDSGEQGWFWLCEDFSGGPHWLVLGDHNPDQTSIPFSDKDLLT